jgi:hypothetical protein
MVVCSAVSMGAAYFVLAPDTGAAEAGRISLRVGDQMVAPAIGWTCDLARTKPGVALVCSPGIPGTPTQGSPELSIQSARVAVATGTKPSAATVPVGGGKQVLIVTFKVARK